MIFLNRTRRQVLVSRSLRSHGRFALSFMIAFLASHMTYAQDLAPRAYTITPLHSNAVTLTYSFYSGDLNFNGASPVTDSSGTYSVPSISYYHSFSFFGRSANVLAVLPYGVGHFKGTALGNEIKSYRSGLADSVYRFSVNLKGGPAMELPQFMKWKQKTLLGLSLKVIAPTGQYDPNVLANWGTNRWSFKPEFGYSQRFRQKWVLDAYAGVWFFTTNPELFDYPNPPQPQTQTPVGSFEGHISRDFKSSLWASLDGNFWFGGTATLAGTTVPETKQTSSRIGVTGSFPLGKHQSLKANFSAGTFYRYGGNYTNVSVAWQYSWLGRPK